jgi:hypothetical protein
MFLTLGASSCGDAVLFVCPLARQGEFDDVDPDIRSREALFLSDTQVRRGEGTRGLPWLQSPGAAVNHAGLQDKVAGPSVIS